MKKALRAACAAAACVALCAALGSVLLAARPSAALADTRPVRHVVIVGISGLRWTFATPATTPTLWRLADGGSVGSLVDYAQQPVACPDDGWLTLNGGARAEGPRPCAALPPVLSDGTGARIPAMPEIIRYNEQFHESPDWGLLGSLAGCVTAVGPGAALAVAAPSGNVARYLPSASQLTAAVLARCPLTVVDLGALSFPERPSAFAADQQLTRIVANLPADTMLLVTAPGAALGGQPHLRSVVVSGPGFGDGLLRAASTRQPGIVTLTDLTPSVARWLGHPVPPGLSGSQLTRGDRGSLAAAVRVLIGRDTAEQVWISTHGWFFTAYGVAAAALLIAPALLFWGSDAERARRRARWWRTAGVFAAAVPVGTFLANLVPWWLHTHPAVWLYGMAAGWTLVVAAAALAGPWRRQSLGPLGALCLCTLAVLGIDVMTGSRLQLEVPFGLSLLEGGRFYGIGNEALGVYCVSTLVGAAWLGLLATRRFPGRREAPVLAVGLVGLFAVVASGWPGFGAKVGGTIALVPCLLLLMAWLAGVQVRWRWAVPVAASGLVLFFAFALISYFFPATGVSDMGTFAGEPAARPRRRPARAEGQLQCGHAHGDRLQLADPGRRRGGRRRAVAARGTAAAAAGAGVRGGAAGAGRRVAGLAGPRHRLVRRRLRGDRASGGPAVRGAVGDLDGRLRFRRGRRGTLFWYRLRRVFRRRPDPEVRQRTPECSTGFRVS